MGNYVLAVAGSKGGVGKTTTSINLGACFASAGYKTVVVEADLAMANVADFIDFDANLNEAQTVLDVLAGDASVVDVAYEIDDCLSVVPSGTDLDQYESVDVDRLESALEHLWWHYNVVIIDTPAGMGDEVLKPIELADEILLISTPRVSSIRNTHTTKEVAQRTGTDIRGLVLTKSGTGASPGADRIAKFLDLDLLGHVPEDDAVPHSQDQGKPVVEYAPRSGAALAYEMIASQLIDSIDVTEGRATEGGATAESETTNRGGNAPPEPSQSGTDVGTTPHDSAGNEPAASAAVSNGRRRSSQDGNTTTPTDARTPDADETDVDSTGEPESGGSDDANYRFGDRGTGSSSAEAESERDNGDSPEENRDRTVDGETRDSDESNESSGQDAPSSGSASQADDESSVRADDTRHDEQGQPATDGSGSESDVAVETDDTERSEDDETEGEHSLVDRLRSAFRT